MKDEDIELVLIEEPNKKKKKKVNKKKSTKNNKKHKAKKGLVITMAVLDVLALLGYFITYGPWSYARNLLITTAMTTMSHKYLARTFYSEETINKVLSNNYVIESGESTDSSQITFISKDTGVYESIYEEQILKHDEDEEYKLIPISGNNYKGVMAVIYDASRVELVTAKYFGRYGERVRTMAVDNNAILAMNASGFVDTNRQGDGGIPTGVVIKDGKILHRDSTSGVSSIIGFNKDNVLVLTKSTPEVAIKNGIEDAVEFGPFLIVNGKPASIKGDGGWGIASRSVIAQRKDGIVLFLVIDGRRPGYSIGVDMQELTKILQNYGAYNAANLDGGNSSVLIVNGKLYNRPNALTETGERSGPNAWIFK